MDMDITHTSSKKYAPYVMLTVTEPFVTILTLDRQRFVKTELHRNETAVLVYWLMLGHGRKEVVPA